MHLAAPGDDTPDRFADLHRVAVACLHELTKAGRVDAEGVNRYLDLVGLHGQRRVETLRSLRERARRLKHPPGAERFDERAHSAAASPRSERVSCWVATSRPTAWASLMAALTSAAFDGASTPRLM